MAYENNTVESVASGEQLMRTEIISIIDEQLRTAGMDPILSALGFTEHQVDQIDGKFTTMLGITDMEEIGEFDEFPIMGKEQGYEKGYELQRFGQRVIISKMLEKWIDVAVSNVKYSPDVKRELSNLSRKAKDLVNSATLTKNNLATRLLANGFSKTSAFGPGSATPDGVSLFNNAHIIKSTGETQSNLVTGPLTQVKLEEAIDLLRNMKDGMGRKMRLAPYYTLVVSSEGEKNARRILNENTQYAASVRDVATGNDITENVFAWDGFKIRLVVLETLNQPSVNGVIGSATMWFLINTEAALELEGLKALTLYSNEIEMGRDANTKNSFVDLDFSATTDAYGYEFIVGSQGL